VPFELAQSAQPLRRGSGVSLADSRLKCGRQPEDGTAFKAISPGVVYRSLGENLRRETGPEDLADYSGFPFSELWSGREKVTELERALVKDVVQGEDARRVLEVGAGFGRISRSLLSVSSELVLADMDVATLDQADIPSDPRTEVWRVGANAYHLPFRPGTFTGIVMIRLWHHLSRPSLMLWQLWRALVPGGFALISVTPYPSAGTFIMHLRNRIDRRSLGPVRPVSGGDLGVLEIPAHPFPIYTSRSSAILDQVRAAGFRLERIFGTGFEEFAGVRHLPMRFFHGIAKGLPRAPGFPTRFLVLRKEGALPPDLLPLCKAFTCPRCGGELAGPEDTGRVRCLPCGWLGRRGERIWDLRYVPPGTRVHGLSSRGGCP
jgi:SAM-dependent methyltransferase